MILHQTFSVAAIGRFHVEVVDKEDIPLNFPNPHLSFSGVSQLPSMKKGDPHINADILLLPIVQVRVILTAEKHSVL